jgi:hypothetical protein
MATGKLLGTAEEGSTNLLANYFSVQQFTAEATGFVTEIHVYSKTDGYVKVAIYEDSGADTAGALIIADNTGQAVSGNGGAGQWNTLTIDPAPVVQGIKYWIGTNMSVNGAVMRSSTVARRDWKSATYSTFNFPDPAGTGFTAGDTLASVAGWGILVVSPSGLSQPLAYGTPKLSRIVKPSGHEQVIAYGTPAVSLAGIVIGPQGVAVIVSCGTPSLRYPQTVSPPGLDVPIACGTPTILVAGQGVIYVPGYEQIIAYGIPTILKYVWHVILDGQYQTETSEKNRYFVIGRDVNGNPVWGEAHDSAESALVGERLDFQPEPAVPTTAQAEAVAAAVLSEMRLSKKRGVVLIPYNCGQELWDVVQITDAGANQSAVKFRVVGIRFEYHPGQARYQHKLMLGAP